MSSKKEGSACIGPNIVIQNILYILELKCNFIALGQLSRESHCYITVCDPYYVIKDRTSRKLIGGDEQQNGIFFYRQVQTVACSFGTPILFMYLWVRIILHLLMEPIAFLLF